MDVSVVFMCFFVVVEVVIMDVEDVVVEVDSISVIKLAS